MMTYRGCEPCFTITVSTCAVLAVFAVLPCRVCDIRPATLVFCRILLSTAPSMGIDCKLFLVAPDENLQCPICTEVLEHPTACPRGHNFCSLCLIGWMETVSGNHTKCPVCRCNIDAQSISNNTALQCEIGAMPVRCPQNATHGCIWTGVASELPRHMSPHGCLFGPVLCPVGCGLTMQRRFIPNHHYVCGQRFGYRYDGTGDICFLAKGVQLSRTPDGAPDGRLKYGTFFIGLKHPICHKFGLCLQITRDEWRDLPPEIIEYAQRDGIRDEVRHTKLRSDIHAFRLHRLQLAAERRMKWAVDVHNRKMSDAAAAAVRAPPAESSRTRRFRLRQATRAEQA